MTEMQTLTQYIAELNGQGWPSGYHDDDGDEWLMTGFSVTRDSGTLDRVNFEAARDLLREKLSSDVEILRFGHFAVGWIDYLVVRVDDPEAPKAVEELHGLLKACICLDKNALDEAEQEALEQSWRDWGAYDFRVALNKEFGTDEDSWPADDLDDDQLWELFTLGGGESEHHSDGPHFYIARAVNGLEYNPVEGKEVFDRFCKAEVAQ